MSKKPFNPADWIETPQTSSPRAAVVTRPLPDAATRAADVEIVVSRIEAAGIDITQGYDSWLNIGFALSSGLGEAGRSYYHRVCRFNNEYNPVECDEKYDSCLGGKREGVTLSTFFYRARLCGIDIKTRERKSPESPKSPLPPHGGAGDIGDNGETLDLPTFSDTVMLLLPEFLQKVAAVGESPQEADAILLGALTVISGCLAGLQGLYDNVTVFPNLFYFLSARASSGKGRLALCRHLVRPIHRRLKDDYKQQIDLYKEELAKWEGTPKKSRGPKPEKPAQTMLFIPANTSSTAVYQLLAENGGKGLIFETEGDTLANAFENDFSNFSDGFRKAFHHEPISYHRRADDEDVEIEAPRLSTVLTGTPKQIVSLIKDAENGLFSRFIFYRLNSTLQWKDVLANQQTESFDDIFSSLGEQFLLFYDSLVQLGTVRFSVTEAQRLAFNDYFSELQAEYFGIFKDDILASVRRLGLICYRVAMVLSALRMMDTGEYTNDLVCLDVDFDVALAISRTLAVHMAKVFDELSSFDGARSAEVIKSAKRQRFFDALPTDFDRPGYLETAERVGVPPSTAEKWVRVFCDPDGPLEKTEHGKYHKK